MIASSLEMGKVSYRLGDIIAGPGGLIVSFFSFFFLLSFLSVYLCVCLSTYLPTYISLCVCLYMFHWTGPGKGQ